MKLPFSFKEFVSNPIAAIAIVGIVGMGYLYNNSERAKEEVIKACRLSEAAKDERIKKLEKDVAILYDKILNLK